MTIKTTTVTQSANEILGVEARNLYYLILETEQGQKYVINVGKKTHDNVQKMIESEPLKGSYKIVVDESTETKSNKTKQLK